MAPKHAKNNINQDDMASFGEGSFNNQQGNFRELNPLSSKKPSSGFIGDFSKKSPGKHLSTSAEIPSADFPSSTSGNPTSRYSRESYTKSSSSSEKKSPIDVIKGLFSRSSDDSSEGASGEAAVNNKGMDNLKRTLIIAISALVLLLVGGGTAAALYIGSISAEIELPNEELIALNEVLVAPAAPSEPFFMLIIGSDSRDPNNAAAGLSDTMMLARVDADKQELTIISVPRDTEIYLEGYGAQKINASFTFGGPAGAVEAVSKLCGVDISYYVEIDFNGVISLVDKLGGVEVDVPSPIDLDEVQIEAGLQTLTGKEALIFSRSRAYEDGDLSRVRNQRALLQAVVKQVLASDIAQMPGLVSNLAESVSTTMDVTTALDLVMKFRGMDPANMFMATVPTFFNNHDGIAYLGVVEPDFANMMERVRQGLPPYDPANPPQEAPIVSVPYEVYDDDGDYYYEDDYYYDEGEE